MVLGDSNPRKIVPPTSCNWWWIAADPRKTTPFVVTVTRVYATSPRQRNEKKRLTTSTPLSCPEIARRDPVDAIDENGEHAASVRDGMKLMEGSRLDDGTMVGSYVLDGAPDVDGVLLGKKVADGDTEGAGGGQPQQPQMILSQFTS